MIYFCLLLLLCSCSHYYQDAATQLRNGRFEEAEKKLSKVDAASNEAALLLLSRAMVYFQSGQFSKIKLTILKKPWMPLTITNKSPFLRSLDKP